MIINLWSRFLLLVALVVPRLVLAQDPVGSAKKGLLRKNVDAVAGTTGAGLKAPGIPEFVGTLIKGFLSLLGVVFLVLLVYGGYRWMMASGNEEEITKAKSIISQAIIGLIIVMAAGAITFFVTTGIETATK